MARIRRTPVGDDEEQEKIRRKGKKKAATVEDDDDDEEGLDGFEVDGFIVDNVEDEEDGEEENPKQTQKKKKKRSSKDIVLDDDDLELIRENKSINQDKLSDGKYKRLKKAGIDTELMEHSSNDEGSLFDDSSEDESNNSEDDMADFIVNEEVNVNRNGDSLGQRKFKGIQHSSSLSKKAKHSSGKAGLLEEHIGEVQTTNTYVAGAGNSLADTDIPERMQIIEDIVGPAPVDRTSIEEESSWILRQLESNINQLFSEAKSCGLVDVIKSEDIVRFLELNHIKKYDIPFIAMYRKEQCPSLLEDPNQDDSENTSLNDIERKPKLKWHKILWTIKELDKKWLLLQKRKNMLMRYYNKHFEEECQMSFLVEESSVRKQIFDSITNMLEKAETEREIDDIDMKFNLYFPRADEFSPSGYRRPLVKSYYSNCRKAGLLSLASKFGNPEKFGSQVTLNKVGMVNEEDPEESPEEMASIYKCEMFQTSEAVLKGARHMAAVMLSCDIPFRKYVRSIFMDKALVSTSPTSKGNIAIDSCHEFAGVKWLQDKPLSKFVDSQWFVIQKAEEEKLLQVEIKLPDHTANELTKTCNDAYLKDSEGAFTRLWNEQRKSILQDTISNFLLPSMEKEARALLNANAKNWLLMKYGMQLWNRVSVAPYQNNDNATAAQEGGVMACCWGNGKPGTTFVMLDSRGELVDVMHAESLTLRSRNINDQQRRKNDQKRVVKFLTIHRPNVIVLGAGNASCIRLKEDINEIISMMSEDDFQNISQEMKGLPAVVLGDEGLPRLYEDSEISMSQLPRQHGIVKRAVALGRYLLNPLAMVATLCGVNKEVVSWKLNSNPLEKFLSSDEKMEIIEWIMIDITNQVGIDINLAIRHDWLLAPLQFVSGLGPKKAGLLHRELLGGTDVRNRRDFAKFGLNTKKVFCNAIGFLQVSCDDPNFVDTVGNTLDRTRIHPESYKLAEELATAVVHRHFTMENPDANVTQVKAIEYIQNDPEPLESFDLNEYADRLETEKGEYRRVTLFDIRMELLHGFKDPRRPYQELTQDEEFHMITGETGDALVEGKKVQAVVRNVQSRQAFCVLDTGMPAILFKEDFSDEIGDMYLTDKLHEGVVLTCKIKLIDKDRCRVNLTCKVSELKNADEQSVHDMDPYYCQRNVTIPSQQEATDRKELVDKHFLPRRISHPHFQNITADQAKEFLADKAVGEYVFHPSPKGLCYLTLSLKIFCGLYVHKDILEGGKGHDMKSLLGLGETLKIGQDIFENIDKVIEHYVNPLVVHLKALINFRKFKKGSKAEVDQLLKIEKEEYPKRIPYGFGISYEHPGIFILSYIRTTNPHHEFIAIHPKGFKFRKQIFNSVEQLVAYFQNHINDNVARSKDHVTGGSSEGWKSNNVDQQKQSIGYNDHGDGRGAGFGRGRGRGRGDRGRGRGDRGRGFGRKSFSHDDSTGDVMDNIGTDHTNDVGTGWANSNSCGWKNNTGKSWSGGGSGEGGGDEATNFSHRDSSNECGWGQGQGQAQGWGGSQSDDSGKWGTKGSDRSGNGGWASGNSSGSKDNFSNQNSQENEKQGQAQGWGKGWGGSQSDDSGKWGTKGSDRSGNGGWASGNSSGSKDNFSNQNSQENEKQGQDQGWGGSQSDDSGKWGTKGSDRSSNGGWASGNSSGSKDNFSNQNSQENEKQGQAQGWGKGWGGSQSDDSGKWGTKGSDRSGNGGWASGNSSGSKDNFSNQNSQENEKQGQDQGWGKGWGGSQSDDSGKWGTKGSDRSSNGGWASGNSSGSKDNFSNQNLQENEKQGQAQGWGKGWGGSQSDDSGKWGTKGSDHSGNGGWASGNSSGSKDNFSNQNSQENEKQGQAQGWGKGWGGSQSDDSGKWGTKGSDHSGNGGWASGSSSGWKDNFSNQNSQENERHAGDRYGDASNGRGWGQGQGEQGRGRGRRGSQGDFQGRGRGGGNTADSNDSGWERGQGRGRGRGRRGNQGDGQGHGRWGGNSTNEESSLAGGSWGITEASNGGSGNENSGWSGGNWKNSTPSGGGNRPGNENSGWSGGNWKNSAPSGGGSGSRNENSGWSGGNWKTSAPSGGGSGSGNENSGWSGGNRKTSAPSGSGNGSGNENSGWGGGGWKNSALSGGGNGSGNENSGWSGGHGKNSAPSGGGSGSGNEISGWSGGNWKNSNPSGGGSGSGNDNSGWSGGHGKNATPSGGGSGWGGTGGKSW